MKIRQGRKASTLVTGFEPFLVLSGEEMAEDLRKICAGATSGRDLYYVVSHARF
jgi:translation initiation factor 2D